MMRIRKPQEGEVVFDLGDFLPGGRKFWWTTEVDEMVLALEDHLRGSIVVPVMHESPSHASVKYQVLHVRLTPGASEDAFRSAAKTVIGHYKSTHLQRRLGGHRAAS